MIKVREVRIAKEVKRSDGWWRFACGNVLLCSLNLIFKGCFVPFLGPIFYCFFSLAFLLLWLWSKVNKWLVGLLSLLIHIAATANAPLLPFMIPPLGQRHHHSVLLIITSFHHYAITFATLQMIWIIIGQSFLSVWVRSMCMGLDLRKRPCWDFTDVPLADEDT